MIKKIDQNIFVFAIFSIFIGFGGLCIKANAQTIDNRQIALAKLDSNAIITPDQLLLPPILSSKDKQKYKEIFALQRDGQWKSADKIIKKIDDKLLLGHVYYQRYMHPTKWRSSYKQLSNWLKKYNDHPNAKKIYRLALRRKPKNYKNPIAPNLPKMPNILRKNPTDGDNSENDDVTLRDILNKPISKSKARQIKRYQYRMHRAIRSGYVTTNLKKLNNYTKKKIFDDVARAQTLGHVAKGYYLYEKYEKSLKAAKEAMKITDGHAEIAQWWGGLAAWRLKKYDDAYILFSTLGKTPVSSNQQRAAGAFWAARSAMMMGQIDKMINQQKQAAKASIGFYSLMAKMALGNIINFQWQYPDVQANLIKILFQQPAIRRAVALSEVDEIHIGDQELTKLVGFLNERAKFSLLAIAKQRGMAQTLYKVSLSGINKKYQLSTRYPIPHWDQWLGQGVDHGLIFAMAKRESAFNTHAISNAGARGLMQIMPATASFIAKKSFRGAKKNFLYDAHINIKLAQDYIKHLLEFFDGNLLLTVASYNAGPGNINKWLKRTKHGDDALLFIESIPSQENRNYVEAILRDFWIYQMRMNADTSSLSQLAAGHWPIYKLTNITKNTEKNVN